MRKNTALITAGIILLLVSCVYAQATPEKTATELLEGIGASCKDTSTNCNSAANKITQKLDTVLNRMKDSINQTVNDAFDRFIILILLVQVGLWALSQFLAMWYRYGFERKYARLEDILTRTNNDLNQLNDTIKAFRHDYGFSYKEELTFLKPRKWYHKLLGVRPQERRTVHHVAKLGGTGIKITKVSDLVKPLTCQYCGKVCGNQGGLKSHEKNCKKKK